MNILNLQIDLNEIEIKITNAFQFLQSYFQTAETSGIKWGEFGWVPFLPNNNAVDLLKTVYVPSSQEEADNLMLKKISESFDDLLKKTNEYAVQFDGNITTFSEAIKAYNYNLYTSCSLDLFAMIDHVFITSQVKSKGKPERDLSKKSVCTKYSDSKNAAYFVIAAATKTFIESLFKRGCDFDPNNEGYSNRNFISHGMNTIIPTKKLCLQLFVLLYNVYLLFSVGVFSYQEVTP